MQPIPYADDIERAGADEARIAREILDHMGRTQREHASRHRHAHRDAHAKSHALIVGSLEVLGDLDAGYAQGMFAHPRAFDVVARLSSSPGDIHSDAVPTPRGFAVKVLDVPGDRLDRTIPGANQDFLLVNIPTLAFGTIEKYRQMLPLLEHAAAQPATVQRGGAALARGAESLAQRAGRDPGATLQGLASRRTHPLGETYFSQGALRHGDYVAKLSLAPTGETAALTGTRLPATFDALAEAIAAHVAAHGVEYVVRVQLRTDEAMPVEDAAVLWDADASPHRTVARLRFGPQQVSTPARRVYGDDVLSFNPWNGVVDHRPLGSIMRVRRAAYAQSTVQRHALNNIEPHEPHAIDEVPD